MTSSFRNVYEDTARADAYAQLEFPGTYFLAYRDLPTLFRAHVGGTRALDFGCGTGRSTRFLKELGFDAVGVDISDQMLARARERDPGGEYILTAEGNLDAFAASTYDLILAAFTFDNIPTAVGKETCLRALRRLLTPAGRMVLVVSRPDIYVHEWASFSTRDFPENRLARDGDRVRIVMLDVPDARPVEDVVCSDAQYRRLFARAGLSVIVQHCPLGLSTEPIAWVSETTIAPWAIYLLAAA